ncbi:MAG: baculoviral IAP repeat-containing protein [Endozoicomonas sp.]
MNNTNKAAQNETTRAYYDYFNHPESTKPSADAVKTFMEASNALSETPSEPPPVRERTIQKAQPDQTAQPDQKAPPKNQYENYDNRLRSFNNKKAIENFPFQDKHDLARNGFYYTGLSDLVECFSCKIQLRQWQEGEQPLAEHKKWSPECAFITKITNSTKRSDTHPQPNVYGAKAQKNAPPQNRFENESERVNSFKSCPTFTTDFPGQTAEGLAEAGFYYRDDEKKTAHCYKGENCSLKNFQTFHDPFVTHARKHPTCKFFESRLGSDLADSFIKQIQDRYRNYNSEAPLGERVKIHNAAQVIKNEILSVHFLRNDPETQEFQKKNRKEDRKEDRKEGRKEDRRIVQESDEALALRLYKELNMKR